jgi:hypothetical protein
MADATLTQQAAEVILKKIIEWAPDIRGTGSLVDLAEAYALVTGKVSSRGDKVTVNK